MYLILLTPHVSGKRIRYHSFAIDSCRKRCGRRVLLINLKVCLAVRHLILLTLHVLGRRIRCHSFAIEARKGVDRHVSLIKLQVCLAIGFDFVPGAWKQIRMWTYILDLI